LYDKTNIAHAKFKHFELVTGAGWSKKDHTAGIPENNSRINLAR
jgi:hypothetical protein